MGWLPSCFACLRGVPLVTHSLVLRHTALKQTLHQQALLPDPSSQKDRTGGGSRGGGTWLPGPWGRASLTPPRFSFHTELRDGVSHTPFFFFFSPTTSSFERVLVRSPLEGTAGEGLCGGRPATGSCQDCASGHCSTEAAPCCPLRPWLTSWRPQSSSHPRLRHSLCGLC